jgi:hypothetical protein
MIPSTVHQITSSAIAYANQAIARDDPSMLQAAKLKLDKAAEELGAWVSGSQYQREVSLLAQSYREVVAALSPSAPAPKATTTTSGSMIDDISDLFSLRDKPSVREEEETIRPRVTQAAPKSLWDVLGGTASKIVAPEDPGLPSPEYPDTYSQTQEEVRQLSPEERPEYAAAIAAGLDPEEALDKVKTTTFARKVASSRDPSATLTTPTKDSIQQPWLDIKDVGLVVGSLLKGWSDIEKSKLTSQIMKQQMQGKRMQLPQRPAREIKRKIPWLAISLGAVGFVAVGVLVYLMARRS